MKKFIMGLVLGLMIAIPVGAHAEVVNMIGKVIDGAFNVKVDGKTLDNQAIVVEGTSYLPVRAFGEATGYDVTFDADLGITLTKKDSVTDETYNNKVYVTPTPEQQAQADRIKKYNELQKQDQDLTKQIGDLAPLVIPYEIPGPNGLKPKDDTYTQTKAKRDALIKQRDDIDQQLKALRNQQ